MMRHGWWWLLLPVFAQGFDFGSIIGFVGGLVSDVLGAIEQALLAIVQALESAILFLARILGAGLSLLVKGFGILWRGLHWLYDKLFKQFFTHLYQDYLKLKAKLRQWLAPALRWYNRIRAWYVKYVLIPQRNLLNLLQRIRAILLPFRILGLDFAKALDRKITDVEARIIHNDQVLLRELNLIGFFLNQVLDPFVLLRRVPLLRSLDRAMRALFAAVNGFPVLRLLVKLPRLPGTAFGGAPWSTFATPLRDEVRTVSGDFAEVRAQADTMRDLIEQDMQTGLFT